MCVKRMELHVEEAALLPAASRERPCLTCAIALAAPHWIGRLRHIPNIVAIPYLHITESACMSLLGCIYQGCLG